MAGYEMREETYGDLISNEPPPDSLQEFCFTDDNVNYDVERNLNDSVELGPAPRISTLAHEDMRNIIIQDVIKQRIEGTPFSDLSDRSLNILSDRGSQDGNDLYLTSSTGNKMRLTSKRVPYNFLTRETMEKNFRDGFTEEQKKQG
jgi:hypothetical protein